MPHPALLPGAVAGLMALLALGGWLKAWQLHRRLAGSLPPRPVRREERPGEDSPYHPAAPPPDSKATLADIIPGMALLLGPMGQVLACNAQARACYGDSLPALLRHPAARHALQAALQAPINAGDGLPTPSTTTITLDVPVHRTVQLAMRRLGGPKDRGRHVLALLGDRSAIEAADRMRADFVAHAGHELRTPLASIGGFIDLLKDDDGTDPTARALYLNIMSQQTTRMQRLIDRLLHLSRLQLRSHARPQERLDVAELFALVTGEVMPRFQQEGRRLDVSCPEGLILLADEDEMVQVCLNLVENAMRYGQRPGQDLRVRLSARQAGLEDAPTADAGPGIVLSVEDNGPGIAAHHLPRLTERFYRVTDHASPQDDGGAEQGTGLGLAIVWQILERHGGRLRFASTVGEGTGCHIWLPAAPQADIPADNPEPA